MKKVIKCHVEDEYVIGADVAVGAAGSHDDVLLELKFSPLWDGTTKQIVWHNALGEEPTIIILTADMLVEGTDTYQTPVPAEAKRYEGMCHMTIKGSVEGDGLEKSATLTTTARFRVLPAMWDANAEQSQDITPTQAVQLQQQIDKVLGDVVIAKESADRAWNSALAAAESEQRAAESEGNAFSSYESAVEYSAIARDAAATATQQAILAGNYADNALEATKKPPVIGANGTWEVWNANANQYIDTGVSATGPAGEDGYTPQKGVDYWTEADKQEIVDYVVDNVPDGSFLPEVSTEENGMVLRVVDGEWAASKGADENTEERLSALEARLEEHINPYVNISVSASGFGTYEKGVVVDQVTVKWNYNRTPQSLTISGPGIDGTKVLAVTNKSYTIPTSLGINCDNTKNFKWTITVTGDKGEVRSATTSPISFLNGVYYGVLEDGATIDSAAILTLTRKLQSTKTIGFTVNAGATQRIAYALPSGYGTPVFASGGFEGGFYKAETIQFTNGSKYTESYDVWLSDDLALGNTSVSVS